MKRLMAIALAVVLLLLMLPTGAVSASPPTTEVEGTFKLIEFVPTKPPIVTANGNVIITAHLIVEWTGDFVGTDEGVGVFVMRPNGDYTLNTITTFTGRYLDAAEGTMNNYTTSRGNDYTMQFQGRMTLVGRTGGLAGLHGKLTFTNDPLGEGNNPYSGKIHFDP